MTKTKVAIIGSVGIPANYGGFETLAEHLVKNLNQYFDFTVYCSALNYGVRPRTHYNSRLVYFPVKANGKWSIIYDTLSILHACFHSDVLLVLGVGGSFLFPILRIFTSKKIIVNIDGLEWKRGKWNNFAKWYLRAQEKITVRFAHTIVADNKSIQEYIEEEYAKASKLIAYGGDHSFKIPVDDKLSDRYPFSNSNYAFSVCRIEPENNIHIILRAFLDSEEINLVMVGNWNSSDYGIALRMEFAGYTHIYLLDAIYDPGHLNSLRSNCTIYVHGHSAGGTNPALVEAMHLGLPVIAFDVNYNRNTTCNKAFYFKDSSDLKLLVHDLVNDFGKLTEVSENLRHLAMAHYTWKGISQKYSDIFKEFQE